MNKAWGRDVLLKTGHQECRIYRPQGRGAENRDKEETKEDSSAFVLKALSGKKIIKRLKMWIN